MPNITKLPTITSFTGDTTFVVINENLTKRLSYTNLKTQLSADIGVTDTGPVNITATSPVELDTTTDPTTTRIYLNTSTYVSRIVAGTNVTISPTGGTGVVTINATSTGGTPIDLSAYAGNILPASNNTYDLGSTSKNWNNGYVTTLNVTNLNNLGVGTPTIESPTNINLSANNAVVVTSSTFRVASFTSTTRDLLSPTNGDIIYNSTTSKFQGYAGGVWVNLG